MVGLFSAWRGDAGGRMGVREEEDRDEGSPGEGVSGVTGLEGGSDDGLELVSSVELRDSLRKWLYLVFGTSSIVNRQRQFLFSRDNPRRSESLNKFCLGLKSFSQERRLAICLRGSARETHPSVCSLRLRSLSSSQGECPRKLFSTKEERLEVKVGCPS